jgi:hypothetical protein
MNYYIEKHDMEIILDALSLYKDWMENDDHAPLLDSFPYTVDDVDGLFQSFDNSFHEDAK